MIELTSSTFPCIVYTKVVSNQSERYFSSRATGSWTSPELITGSINTDIYSLEKTGVGYRAVDSSTYVFYASALDTLGKVDENSQFKAFERSTGGTWSLKCATGLVGDTAEMTYHARIKSVNDDVYSFFDDYDSESPYDQDAYFGFPE